MTTTTRSWQGGWGFRTHLLTAEFSPPDLVAQLGESGNETVFVGAIDPQGQLRIASPDQPFRPGDGSRVIYFAPSGLHST